MLIVAYNNTFANKNHIGDKNGRMEKIRISQTSDKSDKKDELTAMPMSFSNSQAWSKHWKWDTHEQKSSEHVDISKLFIPVVLSFATLTSPSRGYWWNPEIGVLKFLNVSKLVVVVWSNKNGRKNNLNIVQAKLCPCEVLIWIKLTKLPMITARTEKLNIWHQSPL